jgi:hypothetical protein
VWYACGEGERERGCTVIDFPRVGCARFLEGVQEEEAVHIWRGEGGAGKGRGETKRKTVVYDTTGGRIRCRRKWGTPQPQPRLQSATFSIFTHGTYSKT